MMKVTIYTQEKSEKHFLQETEERVTKLFKDLLWRYIPNKTAFSDQTFSCMHSTF